MIDAQTAKSWSLAFDRVAKRYPNGVAALTDLSLSVAPGEAVAFLGKSGSGKTTALKLVNRLEEPTGGRVLVDGRPVAGADPIALRRSMGYVIQEGGLIPHWTVAENVALVPRLLKWPEDRISSAVEWATGLAQIPVAEFGPRYPLTLSGGQRQRVAIARALATRPCMLLLDEPFGALDPITREALRTELRAIIAKLRITTLLVTHDVLEACEFADRIAILDSGRLAQFDSPDRLALAPADDFVRGFFGRDVWSICMRHLPMERMLPYLPADPAPARDPLEVPGESVLADALERLEKQDRQQLTVRGADGVRGPFRRRDLWRLAEGGDAHERQ